MPAKKIINNFPVLIKDLGNPPNELIDATLEALLFEHTVTKDHFPFSDRIGHLLKY